MASTKIKGQSIETGVSLTSPVISGAGSTTEAVHGYDSTDHAILIGNGTSNLPIHVYHWKSYTPTSANITLGSGTLTGFYCQIGKTVHFRIKYTLAANSAVGTTPYFALPVTAIDANQIFANTLMLDASVGYYYGRIDISSSNAVPTVMTSNGAYVTPVGLTATVPFTWTTNDYIVITGTYEAA